MSKCTECGDTGWITLLASRVRCKCKPDSDVWNVTIKSNPDLTRKTLEMSGDFPDFLKAASKPPRIKYTTTIYGGQVAKSNAELEKYRGQLNQPNGWIPRTFDPKKLSEPSPMDREVGCKFSGTMGGCESVSTEIPDGSTTNIEHYSVTTNEPHFASSICAESVGMPQAGSVWRFRGIDWVAESSRVMPISVCEKSCNMRGKVEWIQVPTPAADKLLSNFVNQHSKAPEFNPHSIPGPGFPFDKSPVALGKNLTPPEVGETFTIGSRLGMVVEALGNNRYLVQLSERTSSSPKP